MHIGTYFYLIMESAGDGRQQVGVDVSYVVTSEAAPVIHLPE